ncbi:hypothetical protein [Rhizobium aegyptiacum]|uniref:hypothetical protein n=1 Tax=Rhizobium aegyptiacum TaxID=1764550 RepID=UPI0012E79540|nr:hypothetical protein [Rhizobium aegyptiacum]
MLLPLFAMNWRKYFEQLQPDRFDDFTKGLIRTLLQGKDLNRLDARTQRQLRSILMEFERKQEWLKDKYPCPVCQGEGLQTIENPVDAPIVKDGRGYLPTKCLYCDGMRYLPKKKSDAAQKLVVKT